MASVQPNSAAVPASHISVKQCRAGLRPHHVTRRILVPVDATWAEFGALLTVQEPLVYRDGRGYSVLSCESDLRAAIHYATQRPLRTLEVVRRSELELQRKRLKLVLTGLAIFVGLWLMSRCPVTFFLALFLAVAYALSVGLRKVWRNCRCSVPRPCAAPSPPSAGLRESLKTLSELGFREVAANVAALQQHDGDLNAAVQQLLEQQQQ